jgi:hypothetical protein
MVHVKKERTHPYHLHILKDGCLRILFLFIWAHAYEIILIPDTYNAHLSTAYMILINRCAILSSSLGRS